MGESAERVRAGLVSMKRADTGGNGGRLAVLAAVLAIIGAILTGCGGSSKMTGGGNTPPAPVVTAPNTLTYATDAISGMVGMPIIMDPAAVSGTSSVTFSATPALPGGLMMDVNTGAVSGTPTTAAASANYVITAANSAGSVTVTLTIAIAAAPPAVPANLAYAVPVVNDTFRTPMQPDVPTFTGTVAGFSIAPALPAGLTLDPTSGIVSGTPLSASPATVYTVTAENSSGSTTAQLTVAVNVNQTVLLEQGHGSPILAIRENANNVLSEDTSGHWVLWNYGLGSIITSGDGAVTSLGVGTPALNQIDLAGQVAVVGTAQQLQMYSVVDGHQILSVPSPTWWKLASDGSYLCAGTATSLTAWSSTGEQVFSLSGDYHAANAFAAPGQIQLAGGPSGANVIETDSLPSGKSVVSAQFSGTFNSWFLDGHRFLTNLSNTVWVYSSGAVQQELVTLPSTTNLTGQGNWFWTAGGYPPGVSVYAVGGSATPMQVFSFSPDFSYTYVASGSSIAVLPIQDSTVHVIDLSGSAPVSSDFPIPPIGNLSSFGAASALQWIAGNGSGVLVDGASLASTRRYFGYGAVSGIAGSSNLAAVSTAIGKVLIFNPATATQMESIDFFANNLSLSTDGSMVLAAAGEALETPFAANQMLNLYSLPSTTPSQSISYTNPYLINFTLSGSGTVLGQVLQNTSPGLTTQMEYSRTVTNLQNGSTVFSDTGSGSAIVLSPDGTLIASSTVSDANVASGYATNIYRNGELISAAVGTGLGWLDNGHLFVANYTDDQSQGEGPYVSGFSIVDPTGAVLSTVPITMEGAFRCPACLQFPSPGQAYDPSTNSIYSLPSGELLWQVQVPVSQNIGFGAVAGSTVVFAAGHQVVAVPGP
ncbi:Ig domain-containing protein [Terracidiphilus gabretensis]|uniref:Ig domain-containing protein n=1 Tax=Terracidiphilus gabretensis TaxID=1577687 RepID=UPI00071BBE59|nr:Ig domain-containing protein [Terracidiphilus gabretensis]